MLRRSALACVPVCGAPPSSAQVGDTLVRALVVGVLLVLVGSVARAADEEPDLAWIDERELASGAVLVETLRPERNQTAAVRVAARVEAPARAIWDVLTACEIAPEYVPHVIACRLLESVDDGRAELFVQTVKPAFFLPSFEHVFRLEYTPYRRIDVRRVSGPLEHMEGSWWLLERQDGAILLVYEFEIDPGMLVPRFIVRGALKRDLPRVVAAVRERAENSGG